jgi:hypothetical protein
MKKAGIALGALVVLVGGLYFGFLSHPSPEAVCDHLVELAKKEGGDAAANVEALRTECIERSQPGSGGALKYASRMKCRAGADGLAAFDACR